MNEDNAEGNTKVVYNIYNINISNQYTTTISSSTISSTIKKTILFLSSIKNIKKVLILRRGG